MARNLDIQVIRRLIKERRYQIKLHVVQHALQEGFGEREIDETTCFTSTALQ